jgi:twitching motility protein PilT
MLNSPRIQRLLSEGRIDDIQREIENSVDYYRMQTLDQSLIALIANGIVDREEALKASLSPEDLMFNLRKLGFDAEAPQEDMDRAG